MFRVFEQEVRHLRHGQSGTSYYMTRHASARPRAQSGASHDQTEEWRTIMTKAARAKLLQQHQAVYAATPAMATVETDSQRRCERALDMLLTQRGDASAEVERLLADDPGCVFGHCLRAALVVRAES